MSPRVSATSFFHEAKIFPSLKIQTPIVPNLHHRPFFLWRRRNTRAPDPGGGFWLGDWEGRESMGVISFISGGLKDDEGGEVRSSIPPPGILGGGFPKKSRDGTIWPPPPPKKPPLPPIGFFTAVNFLGGGFPGGGVRSRARKKTPYPIPPPGEWVSVSRKGKRGTEIPSPKPKSLSRSRLPRGEYLFVGEKKGGGGCYCDAGGGARSLGLETHPFLTSFFHFLPFCKTPPARKSLV